METAIAQEVSTNGNFVREHEDSIFANTDGISDTRGLNMEMPILEARQGKSRFCIQPPGSRILLRPSLRLYGVQRSNQNNALQSIITSLDQYNAFGTVEQHWHHMLALS